MLPSTSISALNALYLDFHLSHLPRVLRISDSFMLIRNIAVFANSDLGPAYRFFIPKQNRISQLAQFDVHVKYICSACFDPFESIYHKSESSVAKCLAHFRQRKEWNSDTALSAENVIIFPRLRTLILVVKDEYGRKLSR